jgi:hypothetical protein
MSTKNHRQILTVFLGILALGCHGSPSSGSPKVSSVNKSPFMLPESNNGRKTAGTVDGPLILHKVLLTSEVEQRERSSKVVHLPYTFEAPMNLKYDDKLRAIMFDNRGSLGLSVLTNLDPEKRDRAEKFMEKDLLHSGPPGSYVIRGPNYWGIGSYFKEANRIDILATTTNGHGVIVSGTLQLPLVSAAELDKYAAILNTCIQSVKFKNP